MPLIYILKAIYKLVYGLYNHVFNISMEYYFTIYFNINNLFVILCNPKMQDTLQLYI